jgi:hypothetical protein
VLGWGCGWSCHSVSFILIPPDQTSEYTYIHTCLYYISCFSSQNQKWRFACVYMCIYIYIYVCVLNALACKLSMPVASCCHPMEAYPQNKSFVEKVCFSCVYIYTHVFNTVFIKLRMRHSKMFTRPHSNFCLGTCNPFQVLILYYKHHLNSR